MCALPGPVEPRLRLPIGEHKRVCVCACVHVKICVCALPGPVEPRLRLPIGDSKVGLDNARFAPGPSGLNCGGSLVSDTSRGGARDLLGTDTAE